MPDDFNARTSAVKRHYLYRIVNRRPDLTLDAGHAWRVPRPLDAAAMHEAAQRLVGKHDFTTFRAAECQANSPVKTLDALDVVRERDEVHVLASARSFLHHQVRSMVGSLALVGDAKWSADDMAAALAARDRTACGPVAPPDGLYLMRVDYAKVRSFSGARRRCIRTSTDWLSISRAYVAVTSSTRVRQWQHASTWWINSRRAAVQGTRASLRAGPFNRRGGSAWKAILRFSPAQSSICRTTARGFASNRRTASKIDSNSCSRASRSAAFAAR